MSIESTQLDIARQAVEKRNAGCWPTVASVLLDEVDRLNEKIKTAKSMVTHPEGSLPADPWAELEDVQLFLSSITTTQQ